MIIATAGHVDHGKTELVKALTGTDTDRLPEEKARGLSIDLGFAYLQLPGDRSLGFVDVPGHEKFIRNMLAGVGGIDLGMLVVAADDGVMPQTREHLAILNLLGIEHFVVALTKIDRVDEPRLQAVRDQVTSLFGEWNHLDVPTYAVCAPQSMGIDALREALQQHAQNTRAQPSGKYFRMAIDRAFTLKGVGLVVTGMVFAGEARVDDSLLLSSQASALRVRGIRAQGLKSDRAKAGERCALHIGGRGLSEDSVGRGDWLLHPALFAPTQRIDVELEVLGSEARSLKHWTPVHLHLGAEHVSARVAVLAGGAIAAGERALAQLVLERASFALHGDRFVLRDQSARRTLAGGHVIDPFAPKRGRARASRLAQLRAMNHGDPKQVMAALAESSTTGVLLAPFALARNLPHERIEALADTLALQRVGDSSGSRVFTAPAWQDLLDRIEQAVSVFHTTSPDSPGASPRDIQLALKPHQEMVVIETAIDALLTANRLGQRGARVHLPQHKIQVSAADWQLWSLATPYLAPQAGSPLSLHQAGEALGTAVDLLEKSLKRAVKAGAMVQLARNRYAPQHYVTGLALIAESLADETTGGSFTVAEYCKQSGTGRNFAIELLEYFDRLGFTERCGNQRRIRRAAASLFATASNQFTGRGPHPGGAPGLQIR